MQTMSVENRTSIQGCLCQDPYSVMDADGLCGVCQYPNVTEIREEVASISHTVNPVVKVHSTLVMELVVPNAMQDMSRRTDAVKRVSQAVITMDPRAWIVRLDMHRVPSLKLSAYDVLRMILLMRLAWIDVWNLRLEIMRLTTIQAPRHAKLEHTRMVMKSQKDVHRARLARLQPQWFTVCTDCAEGTISSAGSTECTTCEPGRTSTDGVTCIPDSCFCGFGTPSECQDTHNGTMSCGVCDVGYHLVNHTTSGVTINGKTAYYHSGSGSRILTFVLEDAVFSELDVGDDADTTLTSCIRTS